MSDKFEVIWAEVAEDDLNEIVSYIAERSVDSAMATLTTIRKRANELSSFPNRGRVVPELSRHGVALYREVIIGRLRLIYRVAEKQVFVLMVIDSRRNVEDILLQRLLR